MSSAEPSVPKLGTLAAVRMVLSARPFRRYLIGQTLSGFGNALSVIALAFAVLAIDPSASALGLVMTASQIPKILFVLLGGAIGDRYSRRLVMLSTDAFRSILQATTACLLLTHLASVITIASLQALSGLASAMFTPAANGLVKELAPQGHNRQATSLLSVSTTTVSISGLAVAGALVGILGPGIAFALDAITFAISTLSLALIRSESLTRPSPQQQPLAKDLAEGLRLTRQTRWLRAHCGYTCLLNALALSPFFVLGPVVASQHLGGAPSWAAIAIAWGIGSLIGALISTRWAPDKPIQVAVGISALITPVLLSLAFAVPLPFEIPCAVLAGLESAISGTLVLVALQDHVPDRLLSRATSLESAGSLIAAPIGMSLTGIAAASIGTRPVLLFAAAWTLLSSTIVASSPSVRSLRSDRHGHRSTEATESVTRTHETARSA